MPVIKLRGSRLTFTPPESNNLQSEYNQVLRSYKIDSSRSDADLIDIDAREDDILSLEFEDGGEWIGHIKDINQVFGEQKSARGAQDAFPVSVSATGSDRGLKEFGIKILNLIRGKKSIPNAAAKKLGEVVDHKLMKSPGLFKVGSGGALSPVAFERGQAKYLLFIHGTVSSFEGSFGDLYFRDSTGIGKTIHQVYGDRVLALQHFTVSQSPFENALEVLKLLPRGTTLDILSHSRGGLVADVLASCDKRRDHQLVYSAEEIRIAKETDPLLSKCLEEINILAKKKGITIENVIRVACPGHGTELLGDSVDHFFNGLLAAVGWAFGGKANLTYQLIRGLVTDIIKARLTPGSLPGLLAMVEESFPQQLINRNAFVLKNQLVVIEGDSDAGKKLWHSVLVILSNLYYRKANDFVVNTDSMRYGALRQSGLYFFLSKADSTSHFNYFKNEDTQQALLDVITTPVGQAIKRFEYRNADERDRGVILDLFKKFKAISSKDISGTKPIVILIPGVMGTHLRVNGQIIWADLGEIGKGRLVKELSSDQANVDTTYLIGDFYQKIVTYFKSSHDVYTLGYDWRLSLSQAAQKLNDLISELRTKAPSQPIGIIAHSMGGLVVRDMMRLFKPAWDSFTSQPGSHTVLLGTPWLGSHLIMEVFTGHQSRVRQINLLDTTHNKEELIRVFNRYPGLYDLLPVNDEAFESADYWIKINTELGADRVLIPPLLNYFSTYKSAVKKFNQNPNLKNIYYLAGKDEATTCAYRIRSSVFGKKIQYLGTGEGDGSVTWALGIPPSLPSDHIYYAPVTSHGDLANDESLFDGIRDLILTGVTPILMSERPVLSPHRSVIPEGLFAGLQVMSEESISNRSEEAAQILFAGKKRKPPVSSKSADHYIDIGVVHGDLRYASHPVMVGHFNGDGITNAEAAIDYYYDRKLTERYKISYYPGEVGESLILIDPNKNPHGAVIVGLGEINSLTPFHLRKTIEAGVINYALHFRDNGLKPLQDASGYLNKTDTGHDTALSCLCIGTGYGRLPMEAALLSIISGVVKANQSIEQITGLKPIKKIEFIELYEHVAQNAYYQLSELEQDKSANLPFRLKRKIEKKTGAKRKFQFSSENSWWHNFTSQLLDKDKENKIPRIQFTSSAGMARVEVENTFTSIRIIHALLEQMAVEQGRWNKEYSKTLFEILVPNAFKEIIRQQNNVLWKMDIDTASFPWELFHDHEVDNHPTFVKAGMIRQLYSTHSVAKTEIVRNLHALVISDPLYSADGPQQLPGAKAEGIQIAQKLKTSGFETLSLINSPAVSILNSFYNYEYKVLHIAGHGTISDDPNETGVVLENGMFITPAMLKNMSRMPEFVFINCCYSGTVEPGKEKSYQQRYRFAANIGTQLIHMGVSAAVVAGWPVDDSAALLFASTLYDLMLKGKSFGDAVRQSREACWDKFKDTNNTWGAYQCYGDQWYRMMPQESSSPVASNYFTQDQVLADLYNLKSETQRYNGEPTLLQTKLDNILQNARDAGLYSGPVLEGKADILSELDLLEPAIQAYDELRHLNRAEFTVKALEQYFNLRVKALGLKKENASYKRELNEILRDFDFLLFIGKTSERLNLIGSAYKRLALLQLDSASSPRRIHSHLVKATGFYKQAYLLTDPADIQSGIYPLANWLTLHALISSDPFVMIRGKKITILPFLKEIKGTFNSDTERYVDFWRDINQVNLLECELFYTDSRTADKIIHQIIDLFSRHWDLSGTRRSRRTELDHLEFLEFGVNYIDRKPDWKKRMKGFIREIREALLKLN